MSCPTCLGFMTLESALRREIAHLRAEYAKVAEYATKLEAKLARYQWRPIAEIHEDFGSCVLMNVNDPGYLDIGSNLSGDFDPSQWTHFAEVPKLSIAEAARLAAQMHGAEEETRL